MALNNALRGKLSLMLGAGMMAHAGACLPDADCTDYATCDPDPVEGGQGDAEARIDVANTEDARFNRGDSANNGTLGADAGAQTDAVAASDGPMSAADAEADRSVTQVQDGGTADVSTDGATVPSSGDSGARDSSLGASSDSAMDARSGSVDSAVDAALTCGSGQTSCSGTCVDLASNEQHCGTLHHRVRIRQGLRQGLVHHRRAVHGNGGWNVVQR